MGETPRELGLLSRRYPPSPQTSQRDDVIAIRRVCRQALEPRWPHSFFFPLTWPVNLDSLSEEFPPNLLLHHRPSSRQRLRGA